MRGPILLTGAYRSGSTLLAQMLDAHPQIVLPYDKAHFFRFYLENAHPIRGNYKRIISEATSRFKERFDIDVAYDKIIAKIEKRNKISFADVYEIFMLETFNNGSQDVRWGEKTLLQWSNIPLFLHMFENSQAIHIIRDPRAVLASKRNVTWEKPFRYLDAVFVCLHSMNWAATRRGGISEKKYKIVIYEELIKNPECKLKEICDFLEVPFHENMITVKSFKDNAGNSWAPNTAFGDIENEISSRPLQRWKTVLEKWEILFIESILGELMKEFGYELSNLDFDAKDLAILWNKIRETPLMHGRLQHWFNTGEGIDSHSSDPRNKNNWTKFA